MSVRVLHRRTVQSHVLSFIFSKKKKFFLSNIFQTSIFLLFFHFFNFLQFHFFKLVFLSFIGSLPLARTDTALYYLCFVLGAACG
jgi:hypothetical protein